jgi:hypothetical protein
LPERKDFAKAHTVVASVLASCPFGVHILVVEQDKVAVRLADEQGTFHCKLAVLDYAMANGIVPFAWHRLIVPQTEPEPEPLEPPARLSVCLQLLLVAVVVYREQCSY